MRGCKLRLVSVEETAELLPGGGAEELEVAAQVGLVDEVVRERGRVVEVVHGVRPALGDQEQLALG